MVSGNKTEDNLNNHFKQFDELSSDQNRNSNNTANCMTVMRAIMPFFKTVEELEYLINSVKLDFTLMVKVTLKLC